MLAVETTACAPAPSSLRRFCATSHNLKVTLRGGLARPRRTNHRRSEAGNEAAFPMPRLLYAVTFLTRTSAFFDVGPGPWRADLLFFGIYKARRAAAAAALVLAVLRLIE